MVLELEWVKRLVPLYELERETNSAGEREHQMADQSREPPTVVQRKMEFRKG